MGRRSDHTRDELRALVIREAHRHLAEVGFIRFSAREVAKRIGYSIGTIYNVFGSLDALMIAVNTRTFALWADHVARHLDRAGDDRIGVLVEAYFSFAQTNPNLWTAIYEHRLPPDMPMPEDDARERGRLTRMIQTEVASALARPADETVAALTRSLIASVHGHCSFAVTGAFALLGETDPVASALARVREAIEAKTARNPESDAQHAPAHPPQ